MKKLFIAILTVLVGGFIVFWFVKKPVAIAPTSNEVVNYQGVNKQQLQEQYGKTLIVYYSFTGTTRDIALKLQEKTGADLYRLQLKEDYPATVMMYWTSRNQIKDVYLPELQDIHIDIGEYDTILVGSPVWWYTTVPPLRSFLAQADFKGKIVAPFCTQGGNDGNYFEDFSQRAINTQLLKGLSLKYPQRQAAEELDNTLSVWLQVLEEKQR